MPLLAQIQCDMCGVISNVPQGTTPAQCTVTLMENGTVAVNGQFTIGPECASAAGPKMIAIFPYSLLAVQAAAKAATPPPTTTTAAAL